MSDLEQKQVEAERRLDIKMELGMMFDAFDALRRKVQSMEHRMALQTHYRC